MTRVPYGFNIKFFLLFLPLWLGILPLSALNPFTDKEKPLEEVKTKKKERPKPTAIEKIAAEPTSLEEINFEYDHRKDYRIPTELWYLKPSFYVNYYNLGADIQRAFDQISGLFRGDHISLQVATKTAQLRMFAKEPVRRANTNIIPTGNLSFGYLYQGRHQFEIDFGLAGLVPLNTADVQTELTLHEMCDGNLNNCPLARLEFVNETTLEGKYQLHFVINERIWLFTPQFNYDYLWREYPWGRISFGGSLGLVFLSALQQVEFSARRSDLPSNTPYEERLLEGAASSSAIADWGPILRLYSSFRRKAGPMMLDIRLGINYGWVNLQREVDGHGQALIGRTIAASFPLSAIGIKNREQNKFELLGFFLQIGTVF